MHIVVIGLNHKSAPIELRERLAFNREQLPSALTTLRASVGLHEAAILSTCNRVEIYAGVPELDGAVDRVTRFLSEHARVEAPTLAQRLYTYVEPQSVHHLFAVTSGLDSMVLGEAEILHQVKHAYEWARDAGATGKVFNALFQRALNAAKAVRTHTAIGRGCTSIGSVAVELSEKIFGRLSSRTVLLIGAGKIGELTLKHVADRGLRAVRIVNRSFSRAQALAVCHGATAVAWEDLSFHLREADLIISSVAAPSYVLTREQIAAAMPMPDRRLLCLIDLGVPRNIEPAVGELEGVYVFDIDDLQGLVAHHHQQRQQEVTQSQAILSRKVERFLAWWHQDVDAAASSALAAVP